MKNNKKETNETKSYKNSLCQFGLLKRNTKAKGTNRTLKIISNSSISQDIFANGIQVSSMRKVYVQSYT